MLVLSYISTFRLFLICSAHLFSNAASFIYTSSYRMNHLRFCSSEIAATEITKFFINVIFVLCADRKEFGLDSFISPTLLSNMREKDLRKAISYHLKKIQSLLEPRQKVYED